MEYNQYKCLELYVDNEPQNVFKKGDLVKTGDFDNIEDCENNINQNGYFTWVNTTDNVIKVKTSSTKWLTARTSPVYVGKPTYLRFGYEAQHNLNPYALNITSLGLTRIDTSSIQYMEYMFFYCRSLVSLDLGSFNTDSCIDMRYMFDSCSSLVSLDLGSFNTAKVRTMNDMFNGCSSLNHIKCKQSFKDWCLENQDTIALPTAMREGGSGTWEIVG